MTKTFNGFVAYDASLDRIVLSVAGTDPLKLKDWIDDLDFFKSTYPNCEEYGDEPCEVHEGFMATYDCAKDVVRSTIKDYMADFPTATVHVTGHSLGAIAAVFAAMDLTLTQDIPIASVITFGQPRGGDESFAKFLDQTIDEFRLVHYQDPVPHLPPNDLLGKPFFQHPTTEVFYQERDSTGSYKICEGQEDPSCSDQFLVDINLLNHLHYVGFDFISNYLACKL
ncbi:hypothetical protein TrRE_jg9301 [Triparma retinervis]|uniref:Fungal lipase-type domain-containing protein n=1 Tax=Triparma retinervis TaxID=2557542 RepID=A0A9W6ZAT7_9STRA|nr:hypothetical protein TrRE_jg9301 [Triparma retinervis]